MTHDRAINGSVQCRAPYFEAIREHLAEGILSFHVPGHQGGRGVDPELCGLLGPHLFAADLTEVLGMDDLHRPLAQLKEAQDLAALAFGAEQTHFLVNGSTSGNQAMLLATTGPGDLVLVPCNAHRSVWGALMLSGSSASVYAPPFDRQLGVYGVPTPDCVRAALARSPEARVLVLSSPTYYGHAADTLGVVKAAHDLGLLVLADEAWGAHLPFHPGFPTSAIQAGADLVVQSAHKMLPALTQSALLHVNGDRVDRDRLVHLLRTLLSSSPSAPLLASLDCARRQFALHGLGILEELARLAALGQHELGALPGVTARGGSLAPGSLSRWDPCHLVVSARLLGYSGYDLEAVLRYEHRIQVEMSDYQGLVVVLTAGHEEADILALVQALASLPEGGPALGLPEPMSCCSAPFTPAESLRTSALQVPWQQAAGRQAGELVTLYPPGIPWLIPGQEIREEVLLQLRARQAAGARVQGASDPSLSTIRVLERKRQFQAYGQCEAKQ
jgi:arginine/lysine/ornithine decarboxylase